MVIRTSITLTNYNPIINLEFRLHRIAAEAFIINDDITLMNEYVDKLSLNMDKKEEELKIGDLVELKPRIRDILTVNGVGTIISATVIKTNDFDGTWTNDEIHAFIVYFPQDDYEYTIPRSCLQLFSNSKTD